MALFPTSIISVLNSWGVTSNQIGQQEVELLTQILAAQVASASGGGGTTQDVNVGGFVVPAFSEIDLTYYPLAAGGNSNNIQTQAFKSSGSTVATLTYTYAAGGVANDDLVTKIAQS